MAQSLATGCVWLTLGLLMALPLPWGQRYLLEHWRLCKGVASMPRLLWSDHLHPVQAVGSPHLSACQKQAAAGSTYYLHSAACCSATSAPNL